MDHKEPSESPNRKDRGFWDEQLVREYGPTPTLRTIIQWFKSSQPKIALQTQEELKSLRELERQEKREEMRQEKEEWERQRLAWIEEGRNQKQAELELQVEVMKNKNKRLRARIPKPGTMLLELGPVKMAELEQLAFARGMEPLEFLAELINDAIRRLPR